MAIAVHASDAARHGRADRARDRAVPRGVEPWRLSMNRTWKLIPLAIAGALALSACTGDATRSDVAYDDDVKSSERDDTRSADPVARPQPAPATTTQAAPKRAPTEPAGTAAPALADDELVGVEACDDYLETYRGCHRTLGMYPPDSIEARFQELRSSFASRATD